MTAPIKHKSRVRKLSIYGWYLAACAIAFGLEHLVPQSHEPFFLGQQAYYQRIVTMTAREVAPRYTVIVSLNTGNDPTAKGLASNLCEQRRYLAALIPAIAAQRPSVLVIDKVFLASGCLRGDATAQMTKAFERASAMTRIVVGSEIDRGRAPTAAGHRLRPSLDFGDGLASGLINTDVDNRKIPLRWQVVDRSGASVAAQSLSLKTATLYRPDLIARSAKLPGFVDRATNPFISFVLPIDFVVLQAGALLCADAAARRDFADDCAALAADPATRHADVAGKIVVLGEDTEGLDVHRSVIGDVKGTMLQANYIEALLDGRFFAPVPWWIELAAAFLFFVALQLALERRSVVRAVLAVVAVVVVTAILQTFVATFLGYYFDPWLSLLVFVLKLIDAVTHRIRSIPAGDPHTA
ncbi:MAG: CHASE2 domain-containing protein [Luteibacter sp.]